MGNFNKQRILDLIKTDLMIMSGGKNTGGVMLAFIMMGFVFLLGGFVVSPLAGCMLPFISGAIISSEIVSKEHSSGSGRMYSVLPVSRRELVQSRFVFVIGVNLVLFAVVYLLMLLSIKLKLYVIISDSADILGMMAEKSGGALTEFGALSMAYAAGAAAGMAAAASVLRSYFRHGGEAICEEMNDPLGTAYGGKKQKQSAGAYILLTLCLAVCGCTFIAAMGIVNILAPVALILQLFMQLAQAANGLMLSAVFLTMGAFNLAYTYICSVVEFEDRDI